jgi:hypothetical protein
MNDETRVDKDNGRWDTVMGSKPKLLRMNVPGGWLVTVVGGASYNVSFYPDPEHKWDPQIKN